MISESGLAEDRVLVKKWIETLKIKHLSMISENKMRGGVFPATLRNTSRAT